MAIRVLLADDHPVVRYGLTAMLDAVEDIDVVASVPDGPSALREAQLCTPDVAILDIRMPGVDGVEATRRLRATVPKTSVLLLTMYDDATVFTAMQAGARGICSRASPRTRSRPLFGPWRRARSSSVQGWPPGS